MKKRITTLCVVMMILGCVALLAACGGHANPYDSLVEDPYNLRVRFDTDDAVVNGQQEISVVEVYDASRTVTVGGKTGVKLLAPDDPARGDQRLTISRNDETNNYFLAGWYTERTPRVDADGNPLDRFGELTSVSGREQGYTYSGKWDFESDVLEIDPDKTYTTAEDALVLYAAWIPYFNYEFYTVDEAGNTAPAGNSYSIDLTLPAWSESTGRLTMNGFPTVSGKTFEAAYLDAALTTPITGVIDGDGTMVDYEKGICTDHTVKIYTTWMEGTWFKVYNVKQFRDNMRVDGNYMLYTDLDFANTVWPVGLTAGTFTGRIEGNGHTIKNVTVTQANASQATGGLFGTIGAGASISDLTFENIVYRLEAGSRLPDATFGTLCGSLSEAATLDNVSITSGQFLVGDDCFPSQTYKLGLLSGNGVHAGVDISGITCAPINPDTTKIVLEVHEESGTVELTFVP